MEPALRLILARASGLRARHLEAAAAADAGDLIPCLLRLRLPPRALAWLAHPDPVRIRADLRWVGESGCRVLTCLDPEYPPRLLELRDAPAVIFVQGSASALVRPQVALVGARAASAGGEATAREFAARLVQAGLTVTSGLATGIDAAAHGGALAAGGASIAVCASGLDLVYPRRNRTLAVQLRVRGALMSEQPPATPPRRALFPLRNRLIAALALGVVVVEAAERSGSLHTARLARGLDRLVWAVPGSIRDPLHRGCHRLIQSGASLIGSVDDIFSGLRVSPQNQHVIPAPAPKSVTGPDTRSLDKAAEMLLDAAGFEPVGIDFLVEHTGLSGAVIASLLLMLELRGRVVPHPGGRYCRLT